MWRGWRWPAVLLPIFLYPSRYPVRCGCCAPSGGARLPAVLRNSLTYSLTPSLIQSSTRTHQYTQASQSPVIPRTRDPTQPPTHSLVAHSSHPPTYSPVSPPSFLYPSRYLLCCGCCAPSGGARLPSVRSAQSTHSLTYLLTYLLTHSLTLSLIQSSTQPSFHPPTHHSPVILITNQATQESSNGYFHDYRPTGVDSYALNLFNLYLFCI